MQVVIHRPTVSGARLWIQAELKERRWSLEVRDGEQRRPRLVAGRARPRPPHDQRRAAQHRHPHLVRRPRRADAGHGVHRLVPAPAQPVVATRTATASWRASGRCRRRCATSRSACSSRPATARTATSVTRPARCSPAPARRGGPRPAAGASAAGCGGRGWRCRACSARAHPRTNRPASCRGRYQDVRRLGLRPDVKFLVGDQVYLDAPYRDFLLPMGQSRMKRHISRTYSRTWEKLNHLLAHGGNFFVTDDHEFWNNYPANPLAWITLLRRRTRERWELHARDFLHKVQDTQRTVAFDIGEATSRSSWPTPGCAGSARGGRGARSTSSWPRRTSSGCSTWLRDLDTPGVLVLGQPLLAPARDFFPRILDRGLPDHARPVPAAVRRPRRRRPRRPDPLRGHPLRPLRPGDA